MLYSKIEGQGKPLLILHGFLGMSDNWKTLGNQFAAAGYQVHLLDLRNHGRSFHSDEFTYEVMVQDILEYCNANNLDQIILLGHSMGGKVAMFFATAYPYKVEKLIIADIAPKYYLPHHQDILAGLSAVDFSQKPDRSAVEDILKAHVPDPGTRQFLMKSLYWAQPEQLAFRFNLAVFLKDTESIGTALPESAIFKKPVLFLKGENSNYIMEEDTHAIQHHFPVSAIVTIANAGHWLHAENPKDFYQATISFLSTTGAVEN
ncbi:MAG TPA: alpha/beta fold hydrolase [Flavobacterium sp.]|jgi:pimeloyl-ACP methyl ester carboxylesterase